MSTEMDFESENNDARRDLFAKIARLYYVEDMNQRQIAEQLNISVASVSRALSKAKDLNIVKISIDETREEFHKMEIGLERRYQIREAMVAGRHHYAADIHRDMGSMVTGLLARLLKRDNVLGLGWGADMLGLAENLGRASVGRIDIVPLAGNIPNLDSQIRPDSVARAFAERLEGDVHAVPADALATTEQERKSAVKDPSFPPIRRLWNRLDTVIVNLESLDGREAGTYSADEKKELKRHGAVCTINATPIDAEGNEVSNPFEDRLVAVEFEELRHVRNVVVVGTGTKSIDSVRAALAAGFIHVLVTDAKCADGLL
ncbi:MAG: sugar-binding transcriptional regulator [Spirochaetales bacterium]